MSEARLGEHHEAPRVEPLLPPVHEVYEALVLGTRDYVRKNGFTDVLIGLSGGIDSSLVAAIAVDALGPEHVIGVLMPSRYSSDDSVTDAELLAANLGIRTVTVPIEPAHTAFLDMLAPTFEGTEAGLAEENLQARIRGTILMTMSNKFGSLVLTTGNKSEMATGYSTLYGDMAGGFSVIKDVPKMLVYALCRDRNERAMTRAHPRVGAREAAERRAAARPEGLRLAARVRRARPDHRGLRRGRPVDRRARGRRATTPTPCGGSRGSSTATSTSGGRRRPGCGCRRRRSARTVVCRSPTAGPASSSPVVQ